MAQNDMKAHGVHVRRLGGSGRISSLIQKLTTLREVVGNLMNSKTRPSPIVVGVEINNSSADLPSTHLLEYTYLRNLGIPLLLKEATDRQSTIHTHGTTAEVCHPRCGSTYAWLSRIQVRRCAVGRRRGQ